MKDLRKAVRELAGPLRVEARCGYQDSAILGGTIAQYASAWAARTRKLVNGRVAKRQCSDIAAILQEYGGSAPEARRSLVTQALDLLRDLENRSPGSAKSAPPRRRPPAVEQRGAEGSARGGDDTAAADRNAVSYLDRPLAECQRKGARWVGKLAKLGVETNRDLLYYFPRDYLVLKPIAELQDGERAVVAGEAGVREEAAVGGRRGYHLVRCALEVSDHSGKLWVTSFARVPRRGSRAQAIMASPLALHYRSGVRLLIEGSVKRSGHYIELQYAGSERLDSTDVLKPGALVPVYPLTEGVYQGQVRPAVRRALNDLPAELTDPLPERLLRDHDLLGLAKALHSIHYPASRDACDAARRRLAFEELLVLQLALFQRKGEMQQSGSGMAMPSRGDPVAAIEQLLSFSLTRAQQRAIAEIAGDMASDTPMCRLLQGDVGSGKTAVAAAALMLAVENGCQAALMAPTELLAEQHFLVLSRMLEPWGLAVELLTGSLRAQERAEARDRIADGRAQVVLGTHALIQDPVGFARLGLVVVDEQHRFGVRQRSALRTKGGRPDMLVMTATPIPRTLALTAYGDLDMSVLDEMPPGRRPVKTTWMAQHRQHEAYEFVRGQVAEGRQAYIVCPLIEESESLQAEAATRLAGELRETVFPDLAVGLLHGGLPIAEKESVMQSFRSGDIDVLCSTTVIEVGVDVPNATVMLVLNAERFGLSQLHQLRGRVGRGRDESHCILLADRKYNPDGRITPGSDPSLPPAQRRLRVMQEESDGFAIAEEDLLLRGPGEVYGTRQHGIPDLRLAAMMRDVRVLEDAREAAQSVIERDPGLAESEHRPLRARVTALRARMEAVSG